MIYRISYVKLLANLDRLVEQIQEFENHIATNCHSGSENIKEM